MNKDDEIVKLQLEVEQLKRACDIYQGKLQEQVIGDVIKQAETIHPWDYQVINDLTGMGIWQLDIEKNTIIWSDMNFRLFGVQPGGMSADEAWLLTVPEEDRNRVDLAIEVAILNNKPFNSEMKAIWPDGTPHYIGGSGIVIWEGNKPIKMIGVNWDMTQHWERSETIKFYDDLIYGALEKSHMGAFWSDTPSFFEEFDALMVVGKLLDIERDPINHMYKVKDVYKNLLTTGRQMPEFRYDIQCALRQYARLNRGLVEEVICDYPVVHKDGSHVWVHVEMYVKTLKSGQEKRLLGTMMDITETKTLQLQNEMNKRALEATVSALADAKRMADSANEAKSIFLATMSHEIRTPLNAIIGLNYLLGDSELNAVQKQYVSNIENASQNLTSIVSDILDFSKIEAGELALDHVDFELNQMLNHVRTLMVMKRENEVKSIQLFFEVDEGLPEILKGDPLRIGQILINLGTNAVKFTETGYVKVTANKVHEDVGVIRVRFTVEDTGIGITEEDCSRLFKTFQQADSSTTRKYGGTGLGLSISQSLVELMGGHIHLDSTPGKGSHFSFEIDLSKSLGGKTQLDPKDILRRFEGRKGRKVLVVEDNELNQEVVTQLLRKIGLKTVVVSNGQEAMDILAVSGCMFDMIIMDLQMPVMDGYVATSRIRVKECYKSTPIIVMTADVTYGVKNHIAQIGATDYMTKPIDVYRFYKTIDRHLV